MPLIKMRGGKFMIPVMMTEEKGRLFFQFPFNRQIMAEVKVMKGARWHGYDENKPRKLWSVKDCERNRFQIEVLTGGNPYAHYDEPLLEVTPNRGLLSNGGILFDHQLDMLAHALTRRRSILSCQMGTGKTLAAIEVIEHSEFDNWLWVAPRSAMTEVKIQFNSWKASKRPARFITYERLRKEIQENTFDPPDGIVFDESTKIKNPTAQRSQAAGVAVEMMRKRNPDCYVLLMSGQPSPKAPPDWWHQCEVACPGFLREGEYNKFKARLAIITEKTSMDGGVYPELTAWLDDERRCSVCGKFPEDHFTSDLIDKEHEYKASKNEVAFLYERMRGLVLVKFKKDCLDLPELQYRTIRVEPSPSVKRSAELIRKASPRVVTALMMLRELSDGFQYAEEESGDKECEVCNGSGETTEWVDPENPDEVVSDEAIQSGRCKSTQESCSRCKGTGREAQIVRVAKEVTCPKEQVLIDVLDEHEPIGRLAVYAGFQASVDRCVKTALRYHWDVLRVDGRGWSYFSATDNETPITKEDMLLKFQTNDDDVKVVFIGQAGAAGMGLNLTASPSILFYSNSFNGEDRFQAVERIHRPGMDLNRGATIIDIVHLDVDEIIIKNLNEKKRLADMTMGQIFGESK